MRDAWLRMEKMRQFHAVETTHSANPAELHQRLRDELNIPTNELSPFDQLAAKAQAQAANSK